MAISNDILKNAKDLINDLNESAHKDDVNIDELQEKIRAIDMLLHSIARIKKFE